MENPPHDAVTPRRSYPERCAALMVLPGARVELAELDRTEGPTSASVQVDEWS